MRPVSAMDFSGLLGRYSFAMDLRHAECHPYDTIDTLKADPDYGAFKQLRPVPRI